MSGKRFLLLVTIASLGITAAIAIAVLLFGDFGDTEGRILATTFAISVAGLLSLPAAILLEQGRAAPLAWTSVALTAVLFAAFEIALWSAEDSSTAWKVVGTFAASAVASTQISALTTRLREGDRRLVRAVYLSTIILVLLLAGLVLAAIWEEIEDATYYRALAALAVLDVFLVVVLPLLRRLVPETTGTFRARVVTENGGVEELELSGRDFAGALAGAIRRIERGGRRVIRIERL